MANTHRALSLRKKIVILQGGRSPWIDDAMTVLLPACLVAVFMAACASARADDSVSSAPKANGLEFFEKKIRPLFDEHCVECHSADELSGGLSLESREGMLTGGDSGPSITPGEPDASLLVKAVRYTNQDLQMPPEGRLAPAEIAALEKWVQIGAPDPRQSSATSAALPATATGMSIEEGRQFWSFKPLADPPVPQVQDDAWVRTPIDAFVLARLEEAGLHPAPSADKRTLLRRVTFDLIGLPPTPQEVESFLNDESPDAFAKVVERLLQSPQYGVRWGRHWLDVARYADSNGLDENLAFGNAWRYRDYVVEAFNNDKPFDRFLMEQIAGDLLPGANQESKTATGFLVLGAKVLAEPDRSKLEMDTIDEQLDTIGKAFLGMTIGCARCHDHKFDPIKQSDYYALAAIFKSTKTFSDTNTGAIKHWHEYSFATDEDLAKLKVVDAKIAEKKAAAASFKEQALARLRSDARAKATEYLVAAASFDSGMPLTQVATIAASQGLHPRILRHCRLHLEHNRSDELFGKWHELASSGDAAAIASHYRPLFEQAEAALAAARQKDPSAAALDDPQLERARAALYDLSGFLAVPSKPELAFGASTLAEYHRLEELARIEESSAPDLPSYMGVAEGAVVTSLPIHIRGSHNNLGTPVARDFPEVMREADVTSNFPENQSGRLELARWMASADHPLTARVIVNRVWRWHFGAGIVTSTENFGRLGDRPSHPELLDWLARHFASSGRSIKDLHRLIVGSSTYQMASLHPESASAERVDPENRLLWKFRRQRLEAEQIRDAALAVAGRLDLSLGGKTVPLRNRQFVFDHTSIDHTKYDSLRRAIYLPVIRNNVYTLFEQFDFPDPTTPTGNRSATVVAPQALVLLNSELMLDTADAMAAGLLGESSDDNTRVQMAYERALCRTPTSAETARALEFVRDVSAIRGPSSSTIEAWSLFCHSLLVSNEFVYVR